MSVPGRPGGIRQALTVVAVGVAVGVGSVCAGAPAEAHVRAWSPGARRDSIAIVTFEVPNESETGSPTTALTVKLPNVTSVYTEAKPGWTAKINGDPETGIVRSVTWTANYSSGIGEDQFGLFRVSMKLPDADTVAFAVTQQYADGTATVWDEEPVADGTEPDHPAATLTLAADPNIQPPETWRTKLAANPALPLAGAALLIAVLSSAIAIRRPRT